MACVFLDCDSTLVTVEGIDELARMADRFDEIAQLTSRAMSGDIEFEEVYSRRLEVVRPTAKMVERLGQLYIDTLVPDARRAIDELKAAGRRIWIVSAGALQAVETLAAELGLEAGQVEAVEFRFDANGGYAGYDTSSPLLRAHGKTKVCSQLCSGQGAGVMVGDGVTDAEVKEAGLRFVQFAGVVDRPTVAELADARIADGSMKGLPAVVAGLLA